MIKWHENGGLELKLAVFEKEEGYQHFGRQYRAAQVRAVLAKPALLDALRQDLKRTHILFVRLEAIRISLAKHEVWKKGKSVALRPGYGRINSWCGSLDYELENGQYSMDAAQNIDRPVSITVGKEFPLVHHSIRAVRPTRSRRAFHGLASLQEPFRYVVLLCHWLHSERRLVAFGGTEICDKAENAIASVARLMGHEEEDLVVAPVSLAKERQAARSSPALGVPE